jgi:hypothetical protein
VDEVLADVRTLFEDHGVRATFFVTHPGVETPGHERGLHPNFRRNGNSFKQLAATRMESSLTDEDIHAHIVSSTHAFAPEAKGVRAHSLHYDSTLLPLYQRLGLEYDCSYQIPLLSGLRPFWKPYEILEIPMYYSDYFDLLTGATSFEVSSLELYQPGLKVLDFHPNIIFTNAATEADYLATKSFYHDRDRLLAARRNGRGARTLFVELLEFVRRHQLPTATAGEINARWRTVAKWT